MIDRILATLALLTLAGSLGIIAWRVPHADLIVVIVITTLMVAYDFYRELRSKSRRKADPPPAATSREI